MPTCSPAAEILVTYRVRATAAALEARVEALLLEQTVEVPRGALHDPAAAARAVGRVVSTEPAEDGLHRVMLAQPADTAGGDAGQLLNVLFGNSSLQPDVALERVELPLALRQAFGGPRFGLGGLRRLTGVTGRALTCAALKPMGLAADALASLAATFARAGLDIVKDDHGLADQPFAPFVERVRACQRAVDAVADETGHRTIYVPNLCGTPSRLGAQLDVARAAGVRAVMCSPMLVGLPAFHELVRDRLGCPVLAHPALAGAQRIAPVALLGQLFPLVGADAVIYPSVGGRFSYDRETCAALATTLRRQPAPLRPAAPVPAGGIRMETVGEVLGFYGPDTVLLIGASLLQDPARIAERSRRFVDLVRAAQA